MKNSHDRIFTFGRSLTQLNYSNPVKMKSGIQKLSLVFILTIFFGALTSAQTPINEATRTAKVPPRWPGCTPEMSDCTKSKLDEFIAANIQTPAAAKAEGAGGVVLVEFVIEKNGKIGEVQTLHDPGFGLGAEAVRVISLMKQKKIKWTPAEDKGKRVPYKHVTPVSFNLPKVETVAEAPVKELDMPEVFDVVEVMPRFSGCDDNPADSVDCTFMKLLSHIQTNLVYPDSAMALGVQGPVVVDFVIDAQGNITNPVIKQGLGHGCDEEALRVISMMPLWQPGFQSGKPVAVRMVVPIMFQISKPNQE